MIPLSELKIGNIITGIYDAGNKTYEEVKVVCIDPTRKITECEIWVDGTKDHYDDFEPIKLTDEWLIKFGFKCIDQKSQGKFYSLRINEEAYLYYNNRGSGLCTEDKKCQSCDWYNDEIVIINELKSVHQLQNLFFALTNEELTITKQK